jgi:hypothetical protein
VTADQVEEGEGGASSLLVLQWDVLGKNTGMWFSSLVWGSQLAKLMALELGSVLQR